MNYFLESSHGYGKTRRSIGIFGAHVAPTIFDSEGIQGAVSSLGPSEFYDEDGSFGSSQFVGQQFFTGSYSGSCDQHGGGSSNTTTTSTTTTTTTRRGHNSGSSGGNNGNGETDGQDGNGNSNGNGTSGGGSQGNSGNNSGGNDRIGSSSTSGSGSGTGGEDDRVIEPSESKGTITNTLKSLLSIMSV